MDLALHSRTPGHDLGRDQPRLPAGHDIVTLLQAFDTIVGIALPRSGGRENPCMRRIHVLEQKIIEPDIDYGF